MSVLLLNAEIAWNSSMAYGDVSTSVAALGTDTAGAGTTFTLTGPLNLPGGRIGYSANIQITAGAAPTPETIYGAVVLDSADALAGHVVFTPPVGIAAEGDFVNFDVIVALPEVLPTGL